MSEKTYVDSLESGNVNISDDVIGIITSIAASEIEGVSGLHGSFSEDIAGIFGKKNQSKGVKVLIEEQIVILDLSVVVDFGVKIPDIAWKIQENVKTAVESMTGLSVKEVNIHVHGVNIKKDEKVVDEE
jgi:uncharacterized alkaline shock family protein YloU